MNDESIRSSDFAWPVTDLDPVERMRVLTAGMPHVTAREAVFETDFEPFWQFIADIENTTPLYEGTVDHLRIVDRSDDRLRLRVRSPARFRMDVDMVLRPGWCLMRSRIGDAGMAARSESDGTLRFLHFEGARVETFPSLGRLLRPLFGWNIRQDFQRLGRHFPLISESLSGSGSPEKE